MSSNSERLGFVFPGQGSQKIGMLAGHAQTSHLIEETFQQASEVLGYDLWALCQSGSIEEITKTEVTQPLLLTASVALWRRWCDRTMARPAFLAGHSLGEWSALVCAGVIDFKIAVNLVKKRGQYMQIAVPFGEGAMSAIVGLDDDLIISACESTAETEVVAPVNFNSPGQVVIAGNAAAVTRAGAKCKELGAKRVLPLSVSGPFHTSLMKPAARGVESDLASVVLESPKIPVIHNVNCLPESTPELIRVRLVEQVISPVPWVGCIKAMCSYGVTQIVECGPGKILSGLNKRINSEVKSFNTDTILAFDQAIDAIN